MAGYYSARGAEGTHDPLLAKALVFEKDGTRVALVALDLISTTRGLVEETRKLIEKQTGIPGKHVMISATHSHTGPVLSDTRRGPTPSAAAPDRPRLHEGPARQDRRRGQEGRRRPQAGEGGFARRHRGRARVQPPVPHGRRHGRLEPREEEPEDRPPAGPTDPSVPVVLVETADGKQPIAY